MARTIQKQIASITLKAIGARTIGQFIRELGAGNADKTLIGRFVRAEEIPTDRMLRDVLRSPDTTQNGRAWARMCLALIEVAMTEATTELNVERRL